MEANRFCTTWWIANRVFLGLLLMGHLMGPGNTWAESPGRLSQMIGQEDALLVTDASGHVIIAQNEHKKLIPASTLKVFTGLVAMHYLGPEYRFPTDFFLDAESNLTVKGYGDPLLVSETLSAIAQVLAGKVASIQDVVLDNSFFERPIRIPGRSRSLQPYDAPNGALCANFNTVYFKYHQGRYVSAEPQTPLVPFVLGKIRSSGLQQERITFSQKQDDIPLYLGHLLRFFLQEADVPVRGRIRVGRVRPDSDRLVYHFRSRLDLRQVIARMLDFSNNFIANQLLIAAGAAAYGAPGTLSKGVQAAKSYARQELAIEALQVVEGSGISRKNRLSAVALDRILEKFRPYGNLMDHQNGLFYKTGTLKGIKTRIGYIEGPEKAFYRFVILINTPGKPIEPIIQYVRGSLPDE
jgi:D-alanyl-D-alanine carboxypeptidase/D-alanyl-D-alanine-endopeptidase (penicillin-binding protein 4)